jgi:uncharacterized protein (TIGR02466 family)
MIKNMFAEAIFMEQTMITNNNKLFDKAMEIKTVMPNGTQWACDTYNSLGSYDLEKDKDYNNVVLTAKEYVKAFALQYGLTLSNIRCNDAWVNVSDPGAFQEYHLHPNNHFSAVYYVRVPEGSGDLLLRSAETQTDMFPLPIGSETIYTNKTFRVTPRDGMLVIFRSNVLHMVTKNLSDEPRVSVAMNFEVS